MMSETTKEHVKSERLIALEARVRETDLLTRLVESAEMIGKMCKAGRPPKMTIPVQPTDEDFFICTTLRDAAGLVADLNDLLPCIAQLLDGWHADGTAWSEWDESVRQRVSDLMQRLAA
jgi:hypothetical protein